MTAVPLRFSFSDFNKELTALRKIVNGFLDRGAAVIMENLAIQLDLIQRDSGNRECPFEVSEEAPLRTIESTHFEGQGRKARPVIGSISWKWMIKPVRIGNSKCSDFDLVGLASTKLRILDADCENETELAMWRVELGDGQSPGCYFHTQVLGQSNVPPFPHSVCVPRLPTLFATPMAAVEFLLCELFQNEWEQHTAGDRHDLAFWNSIQKQRMKDLLNWKLGCIENTQGSPWVSMKLAKPTSNDQLFFGKKG